MIDAGSPVIGMDTLIAPPGTIAIHTEIAPDNVFMGSVVTNAIMAAIGGEGNVVMTQMLNKGDTYRVPDRQGLVVIARDGGLLSYLIDGKEKGILGTPGEILVGRSLDLKSFGGKG